MNQTKKICVTFLLAASLAALTGCGSTEDESSVILASDTIESYDSESRIEIDGQEETSIENNETQGLTVKDKKYTFDGNDLVDGTYLQSKVKGLDWNEVTAQFHARYGYYMGDEPEKSHMLFTKFYYLNDNETELFVTGKVFLFDKNDQILLIRSMGYLRTSPHETGGNDLMFYSSAETELTSDKDTWPEQYRKGLSMLFITTDVMTQEELPDDFFS